MHACSCVNFVSLCCFSVFVVVYFKKKRKRKKEGRGKKYLVICAHAHACVMRHFYFALKSFQPVIQKLHIRISPRLS